MNPLSILFTWDFAWHRSICINVQHSNYHLHFANFSYKYEYSDERAIRNVSVTRIGSHFRIIVSFLREWVSLHRNSIWIRDQFCTRNVWIYTESADNEAFQKALDELQSAVNLRSVCSTMVANSPDEIYFKTSLLEACDNKIAIARQRLDQLRISQRK